MCTSDHAPLIIDIDRPCTPLDAGPARRNPELQHAYRSCDEPAASCQPYGEARSWLSLFPSRLFHGSLARIVFISDSSAGRIDSAGLPSDASSDRTSVWCPDFVTKTATLLWCLLAGFG
jgi:hypothetical protein